MGRRSNRARVVRVAALLGGAALLLLHAATPALLRELLARQLGAAGWELIELEMARPGLFAADIERLEMRDGLAGPVVRLDGVHLRYHPRGLLSGRLQEVTLARGEARLPPALGTPPLIPVVPPPRVWFGRLPFDSAQVERFAVVRERPRGGPPRRWELSGRFQRDDGRELVSGTLAGPGGGEWRLEAAAAGEARMDIAIAGTGGEVRGSVDFSGDRAQFTGHLTAELERLVPVVQAGRRLPRLLAESKGRFEGDLQAVAVLAEEGVQAVEISLAAGSRFTESELRAGVVAARNLQLTAERPLEIRLQLPGRWRLEGPLALRADRLDLPAEELSLAPLSGRLEVSGGAGGWHFSGELAAGGLDAGVRLSGLRLRGQLDWPRRGPPRLAVEDAVAGLLGGRIHVAEADLGPAAAAPATLEVDGIDLAELLALERQGVEGSGTLDGRLPLRVGAGGVEIEQGRLAARVPGGVIRYRPNDAARGAAADNPALAFALRALEELQFDRLEVVTDYRADGTLNLGLHITGRSPRAGPRPVDLNVNVEENVPALLRSLRMGERVGEAVDRHLRPHAGP